MPAVKVSIDKKGKAEMDYEGFVGDECNVAEGDILKKLKSLGLQQQCETKKGFEDRKMELENQ